MDKVRFIHLRHRDKESGQPEHYGGFTLAYKKCFTPEESPSPYYTVAISQCSKHDAFNKKFGVTVSQRRLERGKFFNVPAIDATDPTLMTSLIEGLKQEHFNQFVSAHGYDFFIKLAKQRRTQTRNAALIREQAKGKS